MARSTFAKLCLLLAVACMLPASGCGGPTMPAVQVAAPEVTVDKPRDIEVTDTYYYEGYTAAVETVDIYSQVNGYLSKIYFKDGADIKQGDPLLLIDPRPYQAEYDQARAEVNRVQKQLDRLDKDLARANQLLPRKTITQEEYDRVFAEHAAAEAEITAREAAMDKANLDLHFAAIKSPISGRISRRLVTEGNLVTANTTLLTTIVSMKPMFAYFDVDEPTVLKIRQAMREGRLPSSREAEIKVYLGLDIQADYPYEGRIDFVENRVDPNTGTLKIRAVFPNEDEALSPGLHARIKLPMGTAYRALAIPERAVATNQGRKIAYIVDKENRVRERSIQLGPLEGALRVITSGIKADDRVIVNGLQRVRDGITVTPIAAEQVATTAVQQPVGDASGGAEPLQPTQQSPAKGEG